MKQYEGNIYKLKKNSINKTKKKYTTTYHYLLEEILQSVKYKERYESLEKKEESDILLLEIMESIAEDFHIKKDKVYTYNQFNKAILKEFHKELRLEKKSKEKSKIKEINLYHQIKNKNYKELRKISSKKQNDFLKAIYLYTISED